MSDPLASLLQVLDAAPAAELPTLIGQLEAAKPRAWARLTAPPVATRQDWMGERWEHAHANAARLCACQLKRDGEP